MKYYKLIYLNQKGKDFHVFIYTCMDHEQKIINKNNDFQLRLIFHMV